MTDRQTRRDRPSPREAVAAAAVSLVVGAIVALSTAPVAAAPVQPEAPAVDLFTAAVTTGPAWIVSPRAARPGEVVHVRLRYTAPATVVGKPTTTPQVVFAFRNDLRHPVQGRVYAAEGTFGVDLVVPPGTDWGADPIVWGVADLSLGVVSPPRFLVLSSRNAAIPFVASRSAQPPLWNR